MKTFTNCIEDWEVYELLVTKNNDSYTKLLAKYQYVYFTDVLDNGSVEVRRITDISS